MKIKETVRLARRDRDDRVQVTKLFLVPSWNATLTYNLILQSIVSTPSGTGFEQSAVDTMKFPCLTSASQSADLIINGHISRGWRKVKDLDEAMRRFGDPQDELTPEGIEQLRAGVADALRLGVARDFVILD